MKSRGPGWSGVWFVAFGTVVAACGFAQAQDIVSADVSARVVPSVVSLAIRNADGRTTTSTGFLAVKDGVVATAWRPISAATGVVARFSNGEEYECSGVIDRDEKRNVALLRIRTFGRPVLKMSAAAPASGQSAAIAVVRDGAFGLMAGAVGEGVVVQDQRLPALSGDFSNSQDGSPVVNVGGEVVGMLVSVAPDGPPRFFLLPAAFIQALDATLPTRPWGQIEARGASAQPASSLDEVDTRLGEALIALVDSRVAISHAQVATAGYGFRNGMPSLLYGMQQALDTAMGRLVEIRTDDDLRGRLIKSMLQMMANQRAASENYIKAVVIGQQMNTWGAQSQDLSKRSDTQAAAVNEQLVTVRADVTALEAASEKFRTSLPMELRYNIGLVERPAKFRLGCVVFARNPFFLLVAYLDGWAFELGLRAGDTVRSAGGRVFKAEETLEDFKLLIQQNLGTTLKVVVERDGERKELRLKIPKKIPATALNTR